MPKCNFNGVRVSAVVSCVPKNERRIDDELELFGGDAQKVDRIKRTIGLDRRRVVEPGTTTADLCRAAAEHLFQRAGVDRQQLDAVICVTQTPDYLQPCNAAVLHGQLGLKKNCAALDVNLGCSGYVYGLWLAHMMIAAGGCERVLLLAGDTISRLVHPQDGSVAPLFGDGGSATLLERDSAQGSAWFSLATDGQGYDKLIVPAGGQRCPASAATAQVFEDAEGNSRSAENLYMDGVEVFNFTIQVEPQAVRELLDYARIELDAVDYFVFHQANRYILGNIAKRLKVDVAKVPMRAVERYGNQSSASIPSALCDELSGVLTAKAPQRLLLSGFGVGLSWASAVVELSRLKVCDMIDLEVS